MAYKKIVIGLGNPGNKYCQTRHNVGQLFLDHIALEYNLYWQGKFGGEICSWECEKIGKIALFKPGCYMNESGTPVREIVNFYKISLDNVFIVHDDIDLDFLRIKAKKGGGNGGHNGLRSLDKCLGDNNYWRLRIGVGRPDRDGVSDYVLSNFSQGEIKNLEDSFTRLSRRLPMFFEGRIDLFLA